MVAELRQQVTDQGASGKYFALMLHIDDDDLDPYEYRLLGHYRRVCGATNKPCFEGTLTTAKITRMSDDKVRSTRDRLEALGRIIVHKPAGSTVRVTVCDLMSENVERYSLNPYQKQEGLKVTTPSRKQEGGTPKNRRGGTPENRSLRRIIEEESSKKEIHIADASVDAPPTPPSESKVSNSIIQEKELETPPSSAAPPNPLPPLAPPGYRWLCSSVSDSQMHLIPSASNDRSARALCKANVPHRVVWSPLTDRPPCAECVRIANEPPKPINETWSAEVKTEFADLCKMSWSIPSNTTMMSKYLRDINYSEPVTVEKLRKFKANWYKCDFRGKQGSAPKARWISEHWREYTESDDCKESSNGTADAQQVLSGANSATAASDNGRESGLLADGKKLTQNQRFALLSAQQAERERRGR